MRGARTGTVTALAMACALLAGVSAAEAKTLARVSGNTAYADAGKGSSDRNDITVGYDDGPDELIISDTRAGVKAMAPCTKESATEARCPAVLGVVLYMYVNGFGNRDEITLLTGGPDPFPSSGINTALSGGPGADTVRGGDSTDTVVGGGADDLLVGNGGPDILRGRLGRDRLRADDGAADAEINCGPGNDLAAVLDVGLDPAPESC